MWSGVLMTGKGTLFKWMFNYMFAPMQATMFALLAFYVALPPIEPLD